MNSHTSVINVWSIARDMNLTSHFHLVRMSGVITFLPLYAFQASKRRILPLRCAGNHTAHCMQRKSNFFKKKSIFSLSSINPYPTAFPYGNGMVLHFYQQQESSTTKTVHRVINRDLKLMYSRLTLVRISIKL